MHRSFLYIFALLALLAPPALLQSSVSGNAVLGCPFNYTFAGGYCVENACQNKAVKCMKQNNRIQRPDCTCSFYLGKPVCGIKGGQKTAVRLPTCLRRGQVGSVCGAYDSNRKQCVLK
jgi:hypothetical protein